MAQIIPFRPQPAARPVLSPPWAIWFAAATLAWLTLGALGYTIGTWL